MQDTSIATNPLPARYHDFSDVFEKKNADRLPEHRLYNCPIDLQEAAHPPLLAG
jgi:hypothetical protein